MKDAKDTELTIREFELALTRQRLELQQRTIEVLGKSLVRNAAHPQIVYIGPPPEEMTRVRAKIWRAAPAAPAPGWSAIPMPKSAIAPPAGYSCQSLSGRNAKVVLFAMFGMEANALEQAVATVAERQRQLMDFIPVFLTDSTSHEIYYRRGYAFEYFPKSAYGALADIKVFQDKLFATWKKWRAGSLIDMGSADYLRMRLVGTSIPELASVIASPTAVVKSDAPSSMGSLKPRTAAHAMERRLWAGFSRPALRELEKLKRSASKVEQFAASWALARWHASRGNLHRTMDQIAIMRAANPKEMGAIHILLLETDCLTRLGHVKEARSLLDSGLKNRNGFDADLCFAYANTYAGSDDSSADETRLTWINRVFIEAGFSPVAKRDSSAPLTIENLAVPSTTRADILNAPKVSVIMSAFDAATTISMAIESVLAQTWPNFEIIVVDDCSTDSTTDIVRAMARDHDCIVPVRLGRNQGTYTARNEALRYASGEFIISHDADDWSHPQQIESQMLWLVDRPAVVGLCSNWIRTTKNLYMAGPWRHAATRIDVNYASFLFRRQVLDALGGWDQVRVGGDREFIERCKSRFGMEAFGRSDKKVPLAFAMGAESSLTRRSDTHIQTIFYGVRRDYHEASDWWLTNTVDAAGLNYGANDKRRRPFPAPHQILPNSPERPYYDYLFITDFNLAGGAVTATMNDISACLNDGKRIAIFHWRRFDLDVGKPLNPKIWALAADDKLDVISAGDIISVETVIVEYPAILEYRIDRPPNVQFKNLIVVVNQTAYRMWDGRDKAYDPKAARNSLIEVFGTEGNWVPVSNLVRRFMIEHGGYPAPHPKVWPLIIDFEALANEPIVWRGTNRGRPVVGRHGRDHYTKWPSDRGSLLDAYCAERPCTVRILGGADRALDVIGVVPSNWDIHAFNSIPTSDFLRDIDFFIHYPHEDYIEAFGMVAAEGMAAGKPVILPPVFKETFGSAAIYVEPSEVWDVISDLWHDEAAYLDRSSAGREYARSNFALETFDRRVAQVCKTSRDSLN